MVHSTGRATIREQYLVNPLLHTDSVVNPREVLRTVVPTTARVSSRIVYLYFVKFTFCTFISVLSFDSVALPNDRLGDDILKARHHNDIT